MPDLRLTEEASAAQAGQARHDGCTRSCRRPPDKFAFIFQLHPWNKIAPGV